MKRKLIVCIVAVALVLLTASTAFAASDSYSGYCYNRYYTNANEGLYFSYGGTVTDYCNMSYIIDGPDHFHCEHLSWLVPTTSTTSSSAQMLLESGTSDHATSTTADGYKRLCVYNSWGYGEYQLYADGHFTN